MKHPGRRPARRWHAAVALTILTTGCATTSPLVRQECYNPDAQLARLLQPLEAARAQGCETGIEGRGSECIRLQREVQRLAVICPDHAPTLLANAVLAYDDRRPATSQQFLDQVLAQPTGNAAAAALRARIAIEEGNVQFARRLLEQQIRLAPDHPGLHETYAAALYLEKRLPEATNELTTAQALGAPAWRIAYHLGLIAEASGRRDEATRYYARALEGNPGWATAESRLRALRAQAAATP